MSNIDWLDLDASLLKTLVAVLEHGSVTQAAHALGVTQSAVSHQLDKLRAITGDALFVKSGRGIVATARALALAEPARLLLRDMERFAHAGDFDPARWQATVTIAANDFQREVLLPSLMVRLRISAPGVTLRVIPSDVPSLDMLRDRHCDIAISPRPPEGSDILQQRLFVDEYRVYYDPGVREPPRQLKDYEAAEHITVVYEPRRSLQVDTDLAAAGVRRHFAVQVPGFAALPAFLAGSDWLATAPSLLALGFMRPFASVAVPVSKCPRLPMYLIWHRQHHDDAAHRWLREQLLEVAKAALPQPPARRSRNTRPRSV
ncbi:LysR family transcriptional regulator [Hydrogenophaga sp. 5NK40-0174]|uniref:LysR family transcriptional regulator n=1 Tax=Hydrogenophaga sp. 5NK40-0174 TaxID=3127649 RepID=UPI003103AD88